MKTDLETQSLMMVSKKMDNGRFGAGATAYRLLFSPRFGGKNFWQ
jgi:hypothetical protein